MRPKSSETSRNRLCRTITTRPSQLSLNLQHRLREPLRLPLNSFTYYWTLSSKFFSTFPHGTCSLSVSGSYLALWEVYLTLWAALPSNSTLEVHQPSKQTVTTGLSPSMDSGPCQRNLNASTPSDEVTPNTTFHATKGWQFSAGLLRVHSPLLTQSQLFSFPPLINMLKFGG